MQQAVQKLQQEATQLEQALGHLERTHEKDPAAGSALQVLRHKLDAIRKSLGMHRAQAARAAPGTGPARQRPQPGGHRPGKHPGRHHDLIDEVLHGVDDGRIFVDRGAHRGDLDHHDGQEIDPAAQDTWIGSGEGVKLFSEVFGAFLPGEGSPARRGHHHKHRPGHGGHQDDRPGPDRPGPRRRRKKKTGFFASLFKGLEDFADDVAHAAHAGAGILGKAMHYAEMGMHGLDVVEHAAGKVHDLAGKAEGFLHRIHLDGAAGLAHKVGDAAGWVDDKSKEAHEGLKTADHYLGEGKKDLGKVESFGHKASHALKGAEHGKFGELNSLFRAAKSGDGIDGKLQPEKVRLGSAFDEPRRLDASTLSRMGTFLGGDFAGVRVHTGPGAAEITGRYAAEAVTVKDHIFFAPGRFNPTTLEGQKLIAHELTHVLQRGRKNLDVRTAESEALHSEHSYGQAPQMETLNLAQPQPDFKLADGEGLGLSTGIHTAKRTRSRGGDAGGRDELPDGEEFLDKVSGRVYELLMEELEHSFESR